MIGYDSDAELMKYYRIDKMVKLSVVEEKRDGKKAFQEMDFHPF